LGRGGGVLAALAGQQNKVERSMGKRRGLVATSMLGASLVFGMAGTAAADLIQINIPAPVSRAEGVGLSVGGVIGVGHTQSAAAPTSGDAVANAVEIGGKPPVAVLGSTQHGPGATNNALLDTKQTPVGRVEAAPSSAKVTETASTRQADSNAALGRGNLLSPDFASIAVLESTSSATHQGLLSSAYSTSDALVLNMGGANGTTIRLLHSESSSAGKGLTYIIAINDKPIVSVTELTSQICSLPLPEAIRLSCVEVTGGVGAVTSKVLEATVGGANGLTAKAVTASGSGGAGSVLTLNTPGAPVVQAATTVRAADTGRSLPRTGVQVLFLSLVALAVIGLGTVLVRMRRTR
jgi:hypothetical protein